MVSNSICDEVIVCFVFSGMNGAEEHSIMKVPFDDLCCLLFHD